MVVTQIAMTMRGGPHANRFPHRVGRAVLTHLADGDIVIRLAAGSASCIHSGIGTFTRRLHRGGMHIVRMHPVEVIFQHQLPVAVIGMLEHAAGNLHLAIRRAIDHVVERTEHVAETLLQ